MWALAAQRITDAFYRIREIPARLEAAPGFRHLRDLPPCFHDGIGLPEDLFAKYTALPGRAQHFDNHASVSDSDHAIVPIVVPKSITRKDFRLQRRDRSRLGRRCREVLMEHGVGRGFPARTSPR